MAETEKPLADDQQQAYLDACYPFIEQGAEPPGRAVPYGPDQVGRRWEGSLGWRTRHGQATVQWRMGSPRAVFGALLPNGTRGDVGHVLDHGYRRKASDEKRWVYGTIDIRSDEVVFTDDAAQPVYTPPTLCDEADLEAVLAGDQAFLTALRDDRVATAMYAVFRNREFVRVADFAIWSCGDRRAAHLVADLRGLGESYQDYFPHIVVAGTWPDDRPHIEAQLRQRLEAGERMLATPTTDVPIGARFEGEVVETHEQAERIKRRLQNFYEQARPTMEADVASVRVQLAELQDEPNHDGMDALRAHLTRLGWRTLNQNDERRMGEDAMRQGLDLLENIKRREALPPSEPGAWWRARVSSSARTGMSIIRVDALAGLTPDQLAVRRGLGRRIDALASSGRASEDEYQAMQNRDVAVQQRIGGYTKR